tara:strand:+ start:228 stop:557 length:330 start_codon:yes stop_codon:yes gene_type:complete
MDFSGAAASFLVANQLLETLKIGQILIFSLLKVRKKTASILAGITIAALSLWGLSMWQNISQAEILNILFSTIIMLTVIIIGASLLIIITKLILRVLKKTSSPNSIEKD